MCSISRRRGKLKSWNFDSLNEKTRFIDNIPLKFMIVRKKSLIKVEKVMEK
jgi:hypothetical protein